MFAACVCWLAFASAFTASHVNVPPRVLVTKSDIIDRIAAGTGLTKIETEAVVNGFVATVIHGLTHGDSIEIRGFGSFKVQHRSSRSARNPRTNEEIELGERYVPIFKPSRELRDDVDRATKQRHRTA
ncbi:MAG TPA: HU family DNA-binding protein [Rhodothermales bacterium]|nr:HU family DNA-binding protein [Rhodothermales bacterium]